MPRKPSVKDMSAPGDFCILLDAKGRARIILTYPAHTDKGFDIVALHTCIDAAARDWLIPGDTPMWNSDTERPTLSASVSVAGWHGRLIDGELRPP